MQVTKQTCRFEAVIFDLDGTLADTFPTVVRIFNRLFSQTVPEVTGRGWTLDELRPHFGPPETQILRNLFPDEAIHRPLIDEFFRLCSEDGAEIRAYPGIAPLLSRLGQSAVKLGVYSGANTRSARIRVGHAGLLDHFPVILGGDEVERHKPDPEGLFKLLAQFGVKPESAIFIGDMVADVLAGRRAGMKTIAVTWGAGLTAELRAADPDFLVDEVELLDAILFDRG
ncbi:MAG: HAD family hydrolase [Acidobacteria bacterium]|nr:HAD family hydrolase [Acidobacteriota bacterium]